ncbi:MAG: ribonuclease catalytic domain-containing protein [Desulfovibrionaceae bacterium]|nr:ribonuclease catalytic domain-containing protein [Desulfovibrionaceae bacterium]
MPACVQYPTVGCLVEFFDTSTAQIGLVLEEVAGKLRLLLPNRRETKLPASRVLPWVGAPLSGFAGMSRDDMVKLMDAARKRRDELARDIPVKDLWEMAQGEVESASAQWFAELMEADPDVDAVAAYGHALLACRTHFRFVPPNFEVYDAEKVARREAESRIQQEREHVLAVGNPFVHLLWNVSLGRAVLPAPGSSEWPPADVCEKLEALLRSRMTDPEATPDPMWPMLIKGLNDDNWLPVQLLLAWGRIPAHYNYWYDRAGYARGDSWWRKNAPAAEELAERARTTELPESPLPFVSIDGDSTQDIDDAFYLERGEDGGMVLTLALACPALNWPFGSSFDEQILHRATSIYLPEGDSHMLPEFLGKEALSLLEGEFRPALVVRQKVAADGSLDGECGIDVCRVKLAANLRYNACQAVLDGTAPADSPALPHAAMLALGREFAELRLGARVAGGAVSLEKKEPKLEVVGEGEAVRVVMTPGEVANQAQNMVAEMMILASAAVADWACAHDVPMLYRTQNVALPREYAGVWRDPVRTTEIMRAMIPSSLETQPRQHAALGLARYAPMTSPLRRYADLVNEAQLVSMVREGCPRFDGQALERMLMPLRMALDGAGQIQRFRMRYWKLLFFKQCTDQRLWDGVVTEETETTVTVALPEYDIFVRGRRRLFDERTSVGTRLQVRIGKVNPLTNDIYIVEAVIPEETFTEDDFGPEEPA